jgi:hypothetical protein
MEDALPKLGGKNKKDVVSFNDVPSRAHIISISTHRNVVPLLTSLRRMISAYSSLIDRVLQSNK